jgi:hypothetical protein
VKITYYSSWFFLALTGGSVLLSALYGIKSRGVDNGIVMGAIVCTAVLLMMAWDRFATHVTIENNRWLINSGSNLWGRKTDKIDISSIVYIARGAAFIFRSWGGQAIIYYRVTPRALKATAFSESLYGEQTLTDILNAVMKIKPSIELDPQYKSLLKDDESTAWWKSEPPRSPRDVDAYVASRYGPPGKYK